AEAWVDYAALTSSGASTRVLSRGWGSGGGWLLSVANEGGAQKAQFAINAAGTVVAAKAPITAGKRHLAGTYDGSTVRLYIDGVEAAATAKAGVALTTSSAVYAGDELAASITLDEVALYGKALSPEQLNAHAEVGRGNAVPVKGSTTVKADAADDKKVERVEFLVDGIKFAESTAAPYSATWNTLDPELPTYNGAHKLTSVAYDGGGQVTVSSEVSVDVVNAGATKYVAELASTPFPQAVTYDPDAATQEKHGFDVTVTNKSNSIWSGTDVVLRPRWVTPDGAAATNGIVDGPETSLGADLAPNSPRTLQMLVEPPALPDGVDKAQYQLRIDLYSKSSSTWFADKGSKPLENPVIVNKALMRQALGLERYYHYEGEEVGGGMQHLVNVANGNSLLRLTPPSFTAPGRGLSTVLDITYNSLERKSESPIGNNFSLAISGLSRFGNPIDIHPNKADEIAGRANRFVDFTDGDGTTHRFVGKQAADGTVYWEEPDGVHLYLQSDSSSTTRRWIFTRPDRVKFFYDVDGYPTAIQDANGNEIQFTLEETPPGEDPGGPKKRITKVTDAAGVGASPAPNRSFRIDYYTKAETKRAHVRGKIERIFDRNGTSLGFLYYDDGNLLRASVEAGRRADGGYLPGKRYVFTYTTSNGSDPAIPLAADREFPNPKTSNQSSRLYSVLDPENYNPNYSTVSETIFAYYTAGAAQDKWKLESRTDRLGNKTTYAYDFTNRLTTVTKPLTRVSKYAYDVEGKIARITNPKDETTAVEWSGDRHVTKVTEPTGKFSQYAYNANGMLTERTDQLGNRTLLEYEDLAVDANDTSGKWKAGRAIPHVSQLKKKTDPKGAATADADDFRWLFDYDAKGNLTKATDPVGASTTHAYNADGTVSSTTDERANATSFQNYDANGFPTKVVDAEGGTTQFGFDDDGQLRWVQDPNHAGESGDNPREYRTYFDYDSHGFLERQSTPKSTKEARGRLIWTGVNYNRNGNVTFEHKPHEAAGWSTDNSLRNRRQYDRMDRLERYFTRDKSVDTKNGEYFRFAYDAAGRVTQWTSPQGLFTALVDDYSRFLEYDKLDRVVKESRHEFDGSTIKRTRRTHYCYDLAGDVRSVTGPRANVDSITCGADGASEGTPFTKRMTYDAAHKPLSEEDALGHRRSRTYDANGNVETITDAQGSVTRREHDPRNLLVKIVEPFDGGTTPRLLTTRMEYDPAGNLARQISPRAWDASGDKATFADYVTSYRYDKLNRLVTTELPTGPNYATKHYQHRAYDANGQPTATSVGVDIADPGAGATLPNVPADKKTTVDYFDTGSILRQDDPANPPTRFDYTPEGWQVLKAPEKDGKVDETKKLTWEYFVDGMVKSESGADQQISSYEYDAGNRLTKASDASGASDEKRKIDSEVSYDTFDQPIKTRLRKSGDANWTFSTMAYDLGGNVERRVDDGEEQTDGTNVKAGRKHEFTYDGADWLAEHLDHGKKSADTETADDRRITNTWFPTGWEKGRRIERRNSSGWETKQTTDWTYFQNGLLRTLLTKNGQGAVKESHDVSYIDNGVYVNGNRTKDVFRLDGPKA
ncbi:MAG TPA: LamG-like jellyroll fold domain-containing protein, partial [Candidatus Caenarcaniphilales bacterium]|nr:LamG-like jellyroll fold domain-containing protein [Candidatus Caenarcaniphilales bacterium]